MKHRILTTQVSAHIGQRVRLAGWVHNLRRLGGVDFLILRDGWGTVQAVTENETDLAPLLAAGLGPETVILLEGEVVSEAQAPGGYELHDLRLEIISPVAEDLPVPINKRTLKAALPTLLDHAVTANRHPTRRAIFRLAAGALAGFRAPLTPR
ncbi:MAG: hypothetical protein KIS63_19355, partial [Caldilineales bacterium]|nr:hypothetical protein [Caldilineales bacterium]